jgi:hypothetical protein
MKILAVGAHRDDVIFFDEDDDPLVPLRYRHLNVLYSHLGQTEASTNFCYYPLLSRCFELLSF